MMNHSVWTPKSETGLIILAFLGLLSSLNDLEIFLVLHLNAT